MAKEVIEMLVEGGNAKAGPTTAPKLAQYKVNIGKLFNEINEKTKDYRGMNVPVKIEINTDNGSFVVKVGVPPVASLIKKELGVKKFGIEKKEKPEEEEPEEEKDEEKEKLRREKVETEDIPQEEKTTKKKEKTIYGNLTVEQAIKIAKMKREAMLSKDLKSALKEVVGACVSIPITVEGKTAKEVLKEIDEGRYDNLLK